jgi:hypothetical protein
MQSKSKHQVKNQLGHSDYQQEQPKANQQLQLKPTPHLFVLLAPNRLISVLNPAIPKL